MVYTRICIVKYFIIEILWLVDLLSFVYPTCECLKGSIECMLRHYFMQCMGLHIDIENNDFLFSRLDAYFILVNSEQ